MNHRIVWLAALTACGGGEQAPPPPIPPPPSPVPSQSTAAGTTSVTHRAKTGAPQALLRAIEASTQLEYDRVVFVFDGDVVPGYRVEYATRSVGCGSGDPVSVQGAGQLVVRFEPARAHDDQGNPTLPARARTLTLAALTEWKLICDFEGQVEFVLGVTTAAAPYRVSEQVAPPPARLVLEVRRAP